MWSPTMARSFTPASMAALHIGFSPETILMVRDIDRTEHLRTRGPDQRHTMLPLDPVPSSGDEPLAAAIGRDAYQPQSVIEPKCGYWDGNQRHQLVADPAKAHGCSWRSIGSPFALTRGANVVRFSN